MIRACLTILLCHTAVHETASAEFKLKSTDRVVFFGDTLVESPMFSLNVETFVRVRYPHLRTRFYNSGRHNQTIADGLRRLERELNPLQPNIVVLCFGLYDPDRRPFDPQRLEDFRADYLKVIEGIRQLKAEIVLVTPPCPRAAGLAEITVPAYDKIIERYAVAIREIAAQQDLPLLDWFSRSVALNEQLNSRTTSRGGEMTPPPLSHAVAAADLLRIWGAEPLKIRIDLDWTTGQASISHGRIDVLERTGNTLAVDINDMPLPWALAGVRAWELQTMAWPGDDLCRFELHIDHMPPSGVHLNWRSKKFPIAPEAATAKGMDIVHWQPIQLSRALRELKVYIRDKHRWRWKLSTTREPEEPELHQAFVAYLESLKLYEDGTANIVLRLPKTFNVMLRFEAASDDEDAPAETQPTTEVEPQPR